MQNLISEYRRLLTADDSIQTLDDTIALARHIALGEKKTVRRNGWACISTESSAMALPQHSGTRSATARRVRDAVSLLSNVPSVEARSDVPEEQYSLLIDTLLVLFHQAYFVLLPKIKNERRFLLEAFSSFARSLPNWADRYQVSGLVDLELGRVEPASESFRAALAATPSDQHDFLSRVQMFWSTLMDRGEVSYAFACLQAVAPRVTRIDFDEFQGLVAATFAEASSPSRHNLQMSRPPHRRRIAR
jgi:tetratricopeptide (TPR) repeat protein